MATDIILSIASKIAEYTVEPVGRQFGYVIFYKSNIERLKTDVRKLEEDKDFVQHSVDAAIMQGEEIENKVQNWLKKAGDTITKAKQLYDEESHAKVVCSSGSFPNLWTRHQLSRKTKKMAEEISEVRTEGNFDRVSYPASSEMTVTASARGYQALDSRTSKLNEIKQELKDPNTYMIGVYGMGGVGKTTLVQELAWQAQQDGSFGAVVMATITNSPDLKRIQGQLADGLGLKFERETEQGRAGQLRKRIRKERNILVILDDIWGKVDLTEIGVPFGDDHKGCKLLLTSRDLNVLNCEMGTQREFGLEVLSEEDSWTLFEKMAGDAVRDFNIRPIAEKVAKCCAGLPLLIITVAKALRKKDVDTWKVSLTRLERFDHEELHKKVYPALELSYNYLESDELRSLFLLIGSFGLNYIHSGELFSCARGLGLYRHVHSLTEARNRHYKLINDLRASSLLLQRESEWVRMHDVVRDVAKSIASRAQPTYAVQRYTEIKQWPEIHELEKYHNIILPLSYIHELPEKLECPELKLLVFGSIDDYLKLPDYFFSGTREVKVLDLSGMMFTPRPPPSFCFLTNLQTLYLLDSVLEDISILAELKSLEILSLARSEIKELPIELGQLTRLQMLDLSNCSGLRVIPVNLISSLTCLEELYMGNCFIQWEVEGNKNKSNNASLGELRNLHRLTTLDIMIHDASVLPRDLQVFAKLERYNIFLGNTWKWSLQISGGDSEISRTLKIKHSKSTWFHLDQGIKLLLNTVEDLCLAELHYVTNVLYDFNGEGFPQLKHLHIQNSAELKYIINSMGWVHPYPAFPNLETLALCNLGHLEEICHGLIPTQSFAKLKFIKVKGCDKLKNLLFCSLVRDLPQLLEINISKCKLMTNVIAEHTTEVDEEVDKIMFPNLHSLTLECLPMLVNFCSTPMTADQDLKSNVTKYEDAQLMPLALIDGKVAMPTLETMKLSAINTWKLWDDRLSAHSYIQNLKSLTIDNCGNLAYGFSFSVARELVKLQYLEITNCQMLEKIIFLEEKLVNLPSVQKTLSSEEVIFPNLETLIISHMDNLKSIWDNQLAPNSFCKLKKMETKFCNKLLNICPSYVLNKLHNLETMIITNCPALEVVFEIQSPNTEAGSQGGLGMQLRTLTLEHLPMLKNIWSRIPHGSLRFQNLSTFKATECESLNHVFPLSVAKELLHLQVLSIENCGVENIILQDKTADTAPRLVFHALTLLSLRSLTQLRSFCPGLHTLHCSVLRKLDVYHCDQLELFMPKSLTHDECVPVDPHPLLSIEKVIHNLEELALCGKDVMKICSGELDDSVIYSVKSLRLRCFHYEPCTFPSDFLQRFTNLENLKVTCSSFVDIFTSEYTETIMKLRSLNLVDIKNLKYLFKEKFKRQTISQNLEALSIFRCPILKNIAPFSLSLQNLEQLRVGSCAALINILTTSTAVSLTKLRGLRIDDCEVIEEIVTSENDSEAGEIAFMKLRYLHLENLPRLTSFCKGNYNFKFPLLNTIILEDCPMMETFSHGILSTPRLRRVRVKQQGDDWRWEGDLNTTVRHIFSEKNSNED